jgi:hypothetical protein
VTAYIDRAPEYARPILKRLRELIHKGAPEVEERIKWGVPSFEYKGLLAGMAAFKNHVAFGFWKAELLSDPAGRFRNRKASGFNWGKITSLEDLPPDHVIMDYARRALLLNKEGVKLPRARTGRRSPDELEVPSYFLAAVRKNPRAWETWRGFSYSHRKEYLEWVTEAKREETRERRLAKTVEWLAQGKGRNWKYERQSGRNSSPPPRQR